MLSTLCLSLAPAFGADPLLQEPAKQSPPPAQQPAAEGQTAPGARKGFSYTYLQLDFIRGDGDGFSNGPDGMDIHGSYALKDNFFLFGGLALMSGDVGNVDLDVNTFSFGLGYHMPVSPVTDLFFGGSLLLADSDTGSPGGSADGVGLGLEAGVRYNASEQFEVDGTIGITDYSDTSSNLYLGVGGVFHATKEFGICAEITTSDDIDTLTLGLRYQL